MDYIRENYTAEIQSDKKIKITAYKKGNHRIFWAAFPEGFSDDNELEPFEETTTVENPLEPRRCYFHIISDDGYSVVAPRNLVPDGRTNLRELGGYNTADMQSFVKHGMLYRSGLLIEKEAETMSFVRSLGLKQIIDFRMPEETVGYEDPPVAGTDQVNLSPMHMLKLKRFVKTLEDLMNLSGDKAIEAYQDVFNAYSTMVFESEAYRQMFRLILDEKLPMLYHCSAGKDRTGVASALILMALGVPKETIIYDYMLTNEVRAAFVEKRVADFTSRYSGDNENVIRAFRFFVSVSVEAIESTFAAIDARYSDIGEFFEKELLVTQSDIEKLKDMLLVKHRIGG